MEIKRHITLKESGNDFEAWAGNLYLGLIKKSGLDSYMCFPSTDRYTAYVAKDLHSMMNFFRRVESELKEES